MSTITITVLILKGCCEHAKWHIYVKYLAWHIVSINKFSLGKDCNWCSVIALASINLERNINSRISDIGILKSGEVYLRKYNSRNQHNRILGLNALFCVVLTYIPPHLHSRMVSVVYTVVMKIKWLIGAMNYLWYFYVSTNIGSSNLTTVGLIYQIEVTYIKFIGLFWGFNKARHMKA